MLKEISLNGFANHNNLVLTFNRFNLFYGNNGVGKTNLLEAIYIFTSHFFTQDNFLQSTFEDNRFYCTLTAVFERNSEQMKQRLFFQENKVTLYHQGQKVFLNDFFGWIPIVYFGENTNLLNNHSQRSKFLHLATRQSDPKYNVLLQEVKNKINNWQKEVFEFTKMNGYQLQRLQEQEAQMIESFYQVVQSHKKFIFFLNKEIDLLLQNYFTHLAFRFRLDLVLWQKLDLNDNPNVFFQKTKKHLLNIRLGLLPETKEIDILINSFGFVFTNKKATLSQSTKQLTELIVQMALANLIQNQRSDEVIFLLDNFFYFDFFNQSQILKIMKNFKQFIITTNELSFVEDNLLKSQNIQIAKIIKNE